MDWIYSTLYWYGALFILWIIFFPLSQKILGRFFPDQGYAFAKIMAILFLSYSVFVLGIMKILPFTQISLIFIIVLFALLNFLIFKKNKIRITNKELPIIFLIVFEEFLFLVALFFWAFIRGQEPSIRGLEKYMDFGFINSILRAKYFPPKDMWLTPFYINYYYFGHLTTAVLTKLSFLPSFITFNLTLSTIAALSFVSAFSIGANLLKNFIRQL